MTPKTLALWAAGIVLSLVTAAGVVSLMKAEIVADINRKGQRIEREWQRVTDGLSADARDSDATASQQHEEIDRKWPD